MMNPPFYQAKFDEYRACVIIPTFNNDTTLSKVISDVAYFTSNIIVVNDGSTDASGSVLKNIPGIRLIDYEINRGKGWAIRQGFKCASTLGYRFAITIDSDGQHFANDLPRFIDLLSGNADAIIVGARNMEQENVPGKSSFGNRFSNFWLKIETGVRLPDSQSGYRCYPVWLLKDMNFFTRKYEFEIEVLVRSSWKGMQLLSVPINVYYPPGKERISHFRPFRDFTRISILNTILVLAAIFYIKPRDFIRNIFYNKEWKHHFFGTDDSDWVKSFSIAFGIFMGIVPIWGFQLVIAIFLAVVLRLNKVLVIIAANISIPPMIPLIIFLSYKMGAYWMPGNAINIPYSYKITFETARLHLQQYILGSITLAVISAVIVGFIAFVILRLFRRKTSSETGQQV